MSRVASDASRVVRRVGHRPVVEAGSVPGYGPVFNAGVVHHAGRYQLVARAVRDGYRLGEPGGPRFVDYVSDLLVFSSTDGGSYEFEYVLAMAGSEGVYSFEDPRLQWVGAPGHEQLIMTYTNLPAPESGLPWRIGAHRLVLDGKRLTLAPGGGRLLGPNGLPNKDAVLFTLADGRVALVHRIHPSMQLAVFDDLEHLWDAGESYWQAHLALLHEHVLIEPGEGVLGVGAGAPPVLTDEGFLLFFHERLADGSYTMNLALLDAESGRLRARLSEPLLRAELEWELYGDVDNVVFVQGAHLDGDEIYLTYGAADRCVGAARARVAHLLSALSDENDLELAS